MQQAKGKGTATLDIGSSKYGQIYGDTDIFRTVRKLKFTSGQLFVVFDETHNHYKRPDGQWDFRRIEIFISLPGYSETFYTPKGNRAIKASLNSSSIDAINRGYQRGGSSSECSYSCTYADRVDGKLTLEYEATEPPEIHNVRIEAEDERKPVEIKWESKNQEKFTLEIRDGSRVEWSTNGGTETSIIIPARTLKAGNKRLSIKIIDTQNGYFTDNYATEDQSFTLESTAPKIKQIKTKELNIDKDLNLMWDANLQEKYTLIVNGHSYAGTTQKQCKLKLEDLKWGQNNATLTLSNEDEGITATDTKSFIFNVTADNPSVTALDPSDVDVNIEKNVIVTWMTVPEQTSFILKANGEVFKGDKQETITIPADIFVKGFNTIEITITRKILDQTLTGSKKVNFNGYGKPDKPTFEDVTIYDTALPVINWSAQAQEAFNIVIGEENKEIVSKDTNYKLTKPLKNNNSYTLKLRIKNKYGLWSDFAEKQIKVSYAVLAKPDLELFENQGIITINIINKADMNFKKCELWRRTEFSKWEKIEDNLRGRASIQDNTIATDIDYYYKAIAYTTKEGMSESLVKRIKASLESTLIIDVESGKKIKISYFLNENPEIKVKRIQDIQHVRYQGKRAPDVEIGETDYKEINIRTVFKSYKDFKNFESFIDNSNLLLFKDSVGRAIYCTLGAWGDEEVNIFKQTVISVKLIESLNYVKSFRSENKKTVLKLDQGWKMDTGLKFDDKSYI